MESRDQHFDKNYHKQYITYNIKRDLMYLQEVDRILKIKSKGMILDIGCGVGNFLDKFNPKDWKKFGVDVSDFAIKIARLKGINIKNKKSAYKYRENTFDVIVFRGSIQHIEDPFLTIKKSIALLKKNGLLVFLATPNSNSPYYRLHSTLPLLTERVNILIPSDLMLINYLKNNNLKLLNVHYPYINTPYAKPFLDHLFYFLGFFGIKKKFAFWKSSMEIYAIK
jgi:2-polyprenyl-3-methyl-5-hydroxy-6-metoxy-1,4-benzoquinol methylase